LLVVFGRLATHKQRTPPTAPSLLQVALCTKKAAKELPTKNKSFLS